MELVTVVHYKVVNAVDATDLLATSLPTVRCLHAVKTDLPIGHVLFAVSEIAGTVVAPLEVRETADIPRDKHCLSGNYAEEKT